MPKQTSFFSYRIARIGLLLALPAFGVVAAFSTVPDSEGFLPNTAIAETLPIDVGAALVPPPANFLREERFGRGDTIAGLLSRLSINAEDIRDLSAAKSPLLRTLRPGTTVTAETDAEDRLLQLSFISGKDTILTILRGTDGFSATESRVELQTLTTLKSGTIRSSLFAAADAADIPDPVAIQLAEMFAGDIDFHRDLRRNDRFSVVYEMNYLDGRPLRSGRVLAAEFVNAGKTYRAVWYADAEGKGAYYAPDGRSLRKAFLRSPLEFSRISSGFGMRQHPILQQWRAHRGIDYAAPTGTRVRSVSDGIVEFAGRQGGYGNVVILKHHGQYTTLYAHLNGFAPGVSKGTRVSQGDIIGYVGQTGWATGPHLHYEFRMAGQPLNPLAVVLPEAVPIPTQALPAFRAQVAPLAAQLELLSGSNLAALQ